MKRVRTYLLFTCMLVLAACDLSGITISFNEDEPTEETTTALDEENEAIDEPSDEPEETDETDETDDTNDTNETETETSDEEESTNDVISILQKSFEAMSELTSVHMSAHANIHEVSDGAASTEVKFADMTMFLEEPYGTHSAIEITSDVAETIVSEVYETDDFHYIHSTVHDVDWGVIPNPNGSQQLSPYIEEANIEDHLEHSDLFEVIEYGNEYWLSLTGTRDQAMSSVYGGVKELLNLIGTEILPEMEAEETIYVIIIDKDTHYVNGYEIYYKGDIPEALGEYHLGMEQIITLDSHNDLNEFIVPQEILDEAEPM